MRDKSKPMLRRACRDVPRPGAAASRVICGRAAQCEEFIAAKTVLAFYPLSGEPDIRPLLRSILDSGRTLLLPRTEGGGVMRALRVRALEELEKRPPYGIYEPPETAEELMPDVVLVPGMAFDEAGYRLGHGGGYYDRYLSGFSGGTIGVSFDALVLDTVPREPHDRPVDIIVTERRAICPGKAKGGLPLGGSESGRNETV